MAPRLVPDSFEYRLAKAKLRAISGSANVQVAYFRSQLEDRTVVRPREDVYGLALSLRRMREFAEAEAFEEDFGVEGESAGAKFEARIMLLFEEQDAGGQMRGDPL